MNQVEQRKGAKKFVEQWTNKGYEKGETQSFWLSLLKDVFGVKNPESLLIFEQPVYKRDEVPARRLGFIDAWIPSTRVLIEQKGSDHALDKAQKQSDGSLLTPFQQGKRYADNLTTKNRPRWIVACNFESFEIHDLDDENPNALPVTIALKDLEKEFYRLSFLLDGAAETIKAETKLSVAAGELVGKLYDGLLAQYRDKDSPEVQVSLNKLCVRIVFCLYAEDALLFKTKSQFHDYLRDVRPEDMRGALKDLFRILDTPEDERDPDEKQELLDFPYVNGGLFSDESARIPQFTQELKDLLLTEASEGFNWSEISPTIFGAVFESTLNPETRRKGGMHYTSVENIEKVIKPLFMDALNEEFAEILRGKQAAARMRKLRAFQEKLGSLKFLDPACGSGNFLTETYILVGWYFRAAAFMQGTKIKAAFVSTNSIVQGEQVEAVWRPLIEELGVVIHFAWRTFRWDSEANSKAHVHCVIVGFSLERDGERFIFDGEKVTIARNINGYLLDAPNVFVSRRARPLCSVSEMQRGSQPTDDGNLILSAEEKQALVAKYPKASQFIRPFMMGKDFIERKPRYCLWFAEAPSLKIIRECPEIRRRVEAVKQCRLSSSKAATREKAETPWLFDENRASSSVYIGLPSITFAK